MNIGIDARLIEETGVGRYTQNLMSELSQLDTKNHYVIFLRKKSFDTFALPNNRWQKRLADARWHTASEQFFMPRILAREHLDVVHIPYHNPPIFYRGAMVMTIHDLTIVHFDTGKATTLPIPLYTLKRLGYRWELAIGLRKAKKIIAVSQTTKKEIMDHFGIPREKIAVTYEAADSTLVELAKKSGKPLVSDPYILYVGNAYPHKNVDMFLASWQGSIVLATPDDYFSKRLKKQKNVLMFNSTNTSELANLYVHAQALVFPSLMEGFGLPGIEAMAIGVPVVCSDIPVFREIYGDAAILFDPRDAHDMKEKLQKVLGSEKERKDLIEKGKKQAARYSWKQMARETLKIYEDCTRI